MRTAALVFAALAIATTTAAAQGNGEAGARYYQHWAQDGTLVGDMQGYGAFAMFPLRTDWSLGVSVDRLYYDMETRTSRPALQPTAACIGSRSTHPQPRL